MKITLHKQYSKYAVALLLVFQSVAYAQNPVAFTSSNLPIVIITTDTDPNTGQPAQIIDDPRVLGNMKIIFRPDGTRNYITDQNTPAFLNYNGRIDIEIRGSSSQSLPKKQYGLSTRLADNVSNNNVSIFGMPKENDWILNGLAFDPSLLRDYFTYNLARQLGQYATRTKYCELVINGVYKGLYVFQEKIKDDSGRVNVEEIKDTDNTLPNLTGGYITKADKTTGGDPVAWVMPSYAGTSDFIHELPKPEDVTVAQNNYIHSQFTALAANAGNTSLATGYPSIIDVPTFIDFMIMNELSSNADGYQISTFFHKDRGGKLRAGPVWDFNLTYGNDLFEFGFDRSHTNVWQFSDGGNEGAKFWTDLFNNPLYKCYFAKRWQQLTASGQLLNIASLNGAIDATVTLINEARVREQAAWGTVPNHSAEITAMKNWLLLRVFWMNSHVGTTALCNTVTLPPLVISKINYNPGTAPGFTVANDQEFIEIKNTGTATVNLAGVYLSELGVSYQFPANATVAGGASVFLASNPATFQLKHGLPAFGQFMRNLSNSSQKLVLADGFGNVIDMVEYFDTSPWPNADGNGSYLKLISTTLDNNVASSWEASSSAVLATGTFDADASITLYPNPADDVVYISSRGSTTAVAVYDLSGKLLYAAPQNNASVQISLGQYAAGIYFIKVTGENGTTLKKVVKN